MSNRRSIMNPALAAIMRPQLLEHGEGVPPRLPSLPANPSPQPYVPAAPEPPIGITGNVAGDLESTIKNAQLNTIVQGLQSQYITLKRWRAIDVYLASNGITFGNVPKDGIVVALFALTRGVRTLVATGRFNFFEQVQGFQNKHVIAYRGAIAERFEVTFGVNFLPFALTDFISLAIAASDQGVESNGPDGEEAGTVHIPGTFINTDIAPLELRGVVAASALGIAAATPRWLHIHDKINTDPVAGLTPLYSWGMTDGGNVYVPRSTTAHRFTRGIRTVISTTATTTTAVGAEDSGAQAISYR